MRCTCFGYIFSFRKTYVKDFNKVDTDHDGRISMSEFQGHFMREFGRPPSNEEWFQFHQADKNNDGFVSKYDIDIFNTDKSVLASN